MKEVEQRQNKSGDIRWLVNGRHQGSRVATDIRNNSGIYLKKNDSQIPFFLTQEGLTSKEIRLWMESRAIKNNDLQDFFHAFSRSCSFGFNSILNDENLLQLLIGSVGKSKIQFTQPLPDPEDILFSLKCPVDYCILNTQKISIPEKDLVYIHVLTNSSLNTCLWAGIHSNHNPFPKAEKLNWPYRILMHQKNNVKGFIPPQKFSVTKSYFENKDEIEDNERWKFCYQLWANPHNIILSNDKVPDRVFLLFTYLERIINEFSTFIKKSFSFADPFNIDKQSEEFDKKVEDINRMIMLFIDMHRFLNDRLMKQSK